MRLVVVFLLLFFSAIVIAGDSTKVISLQVSGHTLSAEVAYTDKARSQGLMHRTTLAENSGMLFVFPRAGHYSMWMLNTHIPLSVAYLDDKGVILNILDMKPHTMTAHRSAGLAKFALEMNQGWFSAQRIKVGEKVTGLEQAPAAK
ncbi:MAG: DUF192 domain-containing protein [Nitrosomonas sp.]|nr:DUF192 domain-containing protein [Nitrosomonas sp.]